jgi:hypothetical protein
VSVARELLRRHEQVQREEDQGSENPAADGATPPAERAPARRSNRDPGDAGIWAPPTTSTA